MEEQQKKLMLIDGNSIAYRAFFALPPLSNAKGQQTNAVYGFTQMLLRLLEDEKPTHVAVAFDAGKQTFRHTLYSEYKGTRQKTPSELSEQFPLLRDLVRAFRIPVLEIATYEADDIIGTLARYAEAAALPTVVVSGDKDLLQLVSEDVIAVLARRGITEVDRYDPAAVHARYGLTPTQIVDLKGLMGDTSDNIPGVPGVGEKTAIKLLQAYPTVEEVLEHISDISGAKLQERLSNHREDAILSKRLATIFRDVPLETTVDDLTYPGYDAAELRKLFIALEFKSLLDKISGEIDSASNAEDSSEEIRDSWKSLAYTRVTTRSALNDMWGELGDAVGIISNLERDDYQTSDVVGFALCTKAKAFYVSLEDELDLSDMRDIWSPEFDKVVFDLKSLIVLLDRHGYSVQYDATWFDVKIASYLLNPSEGEVLLSDMVERELHVRLPQLKDLKEDRERLLCRYAMALPELSGGIQSALTAQDLDDLYHRVELPLSFVLARMEALGFYVNAERLRLFGADLAMKLQHLTKEIYTQAGAEFNINSPKQLGDILFEKLGLPAQKKTKTGYSTNADVLEKLAPYHDIVAHILEFRQLGKLQSTYVDGLLKVIRPETGRVHTRFHQALTATGRLSSSEPNLQNIPIRMEEGRKLRQVFEPTYAGWRILAADYSQIELRILAHLSGDEAMIDAFRRGIDIHTRTASDVFEVPIEDVTSLMRRQAKAVNFGIVYGISDFGLSQNLGITRNQAAKFIEDYFAKFPGVPKYMNEIVEIARKTGYVTTLLSRRRYLPDIHSRNFNLRSFAERTAMNTPIQGTAADIIKLAMVRIDEALRVSDLKARMLLQVHDELIFEFPKVEEEPLRILVTECMENAMTLSVPLSVDIHVGKNWYEAK